MSRVCPSRDCLADIAVLREQPELRCEDRIRDAKDTGLRNLPLKGFAQNQLRCEIVALACGLLAWTRLLALAGGGLRLHLAQRWPWAGQITAAVTRLQAFPSG